MKYMKNHFAGILSVILAVVSLSGSSMPVVSANSAERIAKKETIVKLDEKLGAEPGKVLEELKKHEKDGYYLGTPYSGYPLTAENCMRPNGAYGGNGAITVPGLSLMFWKNVERICQKLTKEVSVAARSMRATGFIG